MEMKVEGITDNKTAERGRKMLYVVASNTGATEERESEARVIGAYRDQSVANAVKAVAWGDDAFITPVAIDHIDADLLAEMNVLEILTNGPSPEPPVPSLEILRDEAAHELSRLGWRPGHKLSAHSVADLMARFALKLHGTASEHICDYPACGCCADAMCEE